MTDLTRRRQVLAAAAFVPAVAGCLDTFDSSSDSTGDDGDGEDGGDGGSNPSSETGSAAEAFDDYETVAFQHTDHRERPEDDLLTDAAEAADWLDERGFPTDATTDGEQTVGDFVDATEFEAAVLVAIEVGVPDPGYRLDVSVAYDADEDELSIEAVVEEALEDDEAVAQPLTTIGVLVRATLPAVPPTHTSVGIVDADGGSYGSASARSQETDGEVGEDEVRCEADYEKGDADSDSSGAESDSGGAESDSGGAESDGGGEPSGSDDGADDP